MYRTDDPERDFDRWEAEREKKLIVLPVCAYCDEPIQDDELYDFDGELVCCDCVRDYIDEKFKKKTNGYMEEHYA